jgi:tRNA G18 (ribose-2'-O)-methylase SpoU
MSNREELYLIVHNVRSAYNVGSIFRTAEGLGVEKIYLTGYTPFPDDGKDFDVKKSRRMISKTALGAENLVEWEKENDIYKIIEKLKKNGVQIIALELHEKSQDIRNFQPQFPCALILGNEVLGVDEKLINYCDDIIKIPMHGQKESFNVSVAAGIAIYEILNKK